MPGTKRNFAVIKTDGQRGRFSTRLILGRYFAEIVADTHDPLFHWVVQRTGSPAILQLGQESGFALALERAHGVLESLAAQHGRESRPAWYEFEERRN